MRQSERTKVDGKASAKRKKEVDDVKKKGGV